VREWNIEHRHRQPKGWPHLINNVEDKPWTTKITMVA
jgi:hypothetical protein